MSPVLLAVAAYLIALPIVLVFMVALGRAARYADEIEHRNRRAAARELDRQGTRPPRALSSVKNLAFHS